MNRRQAIMAAVLGICGIRRERRVRRWIAPGPLKIWVETGSHGTMKFLGYSHHGVSIKGEE